MAEKEVAEGYLKIELARSRSIKHFSYVVRNIMNTVEKETKERSFSQSTKRTPLMSAKFYTKIDIQKSTIMKCRNRVSYKDWLNIIETQRTIIPLETCEHYRQFCRHHYIEKCEIPTLSQLVHYFSKSVPYTANILCPLGRAGFEWRQLLGTKKAIIVEKPEQFYQRIQYLQNMKEWRQKSLPILYVEFINRPDIANAKRKQVAVAVSTLTGLVHTTFMQPNFRISMHWLMTWTERILHKVKNPHVIVLGVHADNNEKYEEDDTELKISSPKMDMVRWLEYNDIPHNPNDHRAELYRLVQQFESICKPKQSITEIMKSYGHHVIEQPKGIKNLTMAYANVKTQFVNAVIQNSKMSTNTLKNVLEEFTLEEWIHIDATIRKREERIYQEDMEMEAVVDKLMELAKYGCVSGKEIDSLNDFTPLLGRIKYPDIVMVD